MKKTINQLVGAGKQKMNHLFRSADKSLWELFLCNSYNRLKSIFFALRYGKAMRQSRRELTDLKKTSARKTFVFANGPSLKSLDFVKVARLVDSGEFDLIVLNSFASKVLSQKVVKPTLCIFADPAHFFGPKRVDIRVQIEKDVTEVNEAGCLALIPEKYSHASRFDRSIQFCSSYNAYCGNMSDVTRSMGHYGATAMVALSAALHLDYEEIYLCGYDNSHFRNLGVDEEGKKYFDERHFYDAKDNEGVKIYLPSGKYGLMSSVLYDATQHFFYLEKFARASGDNPRIFNVAKETWTDAFPRRFDLDIYQD